MTEPKKKRGLKEMEEGDREMAVMRRCRSHLDALPNVDARLRVLSWLTSVVTRPVPPGQPAPDPRQLSLDDAKDPFS